MKFWTNSSPVTPSNRVDAYPLNFDKRGTSCSEQLLLKNWKSCSTLSDNTFEHHSCVTGRTLSKSRCRTMAWCVKLFASQYYFQLCVCCELQVAWFFTYLLLRKPWLCETKRSKWYNKGSKVSTIAYKENI